MYLKATKSLQTTKQTHVLQILTPTSNDELLQYAAVVKDNGVFNGNNGRLLAATILRAKIWQLFLSAHSINVHGLDLVAYVEEQEFDKDVMTYESKAEARAAIDVLDYLDITSPVHQHLTLKTQQPVVNSPHFCTKQSTPTSPK